MFLLLTLSFPEVKSQEVKFVSLSKSLISFKYGCIAQFPFQDNQGYLNNTWTVPVYRLSSLVTTQSPLRYSHPNLKMKELRK